MQPFQMPDFYVPWPARLNPNLDAARAHSKAWAQTMGILGTSEDKGSHKIWDERKFDAHDYALLCAYIHPEAAAPELNLMADWNVWAFYVDDYFLDVYKRSKDHDGGKKYLDRVLLFMPANLSAPPAPTNPMELGLADLWIRTAPDQSEAWRNRIIEDTRNLLEAFLWELDSMGEKRLANPIEYISMRRQVGAALWSADLVEHAMSVEIPDRIAATRPMRVIKNTFADAVHLRNDIFSYEREVLKEGELTNAILVIERFLGVSTQRAANLVNDLLTSRLQQFEHTVITELEAIFDEYHLDVLERENVITYVRGLQDWQSGAHEWHIQTSRYLNPQAGKTSGNALPGFTGLGSSAARIKPGSLGLNRLKTHSHVPYEKVGPIQLPEFYMPFKARGNPHTDAARQHSKAWGRKMGMLDSLPDHPEIHIWDERKFDLGELVQFNAGCIPDAPAEQLNLQACWMVWGTYTDDYFAQVYGHSHNLAGAKVFFARLLEFMPVESEPITSVPVTPTERGLVDLWARTTSTMPVEIKLLFRKTTETMLRGWLWELSNRVYNRVPDLIDYIEMRHKTSGSEFTLVLPGSLQTQGIPPEIYRTRTIQELNDAAIEYVFLTNDIFSYQAEMEFEGDINNAVLGIRHLLDCDHTQAIDVANKLMTARMQQFQHIEEKEIPLLFENFNLDAEARKRILAYIEERKYFMSGSLRWHKLTGRYNELELRRAAKPLPELPSGLGTAAARILQTIRSAGANTAASPPEVDMKSTSDSDNVGKTFAVSHLVPPFAKQRQDAPD